MNRIISFDICSVVSLTILIISLFVRKMKKGHSNRMFFALCITVLLSGIFDILRTVYSAFSVPSETSIAITYAFNYLYFLTRTFSAPVYILYIFAFLGLWHDFITKRSVHVVWAIPAALIFIFITADIYFHKIFYIDENLVYHRGPLLGVLFAIYAWEMGYSVVILLKTRHLLHRTKFWGLLCLIPITIIGILIQSYNQRLMLEVFSTSFPLLLMSLAVQRAEEIINFETGSLNYSAFFEDVQRHFRANRKIKILIISVKNYKKIRRQLGSEKYLKFFEQLIIKFDQICAQVECDAYYLESGVFAICSLKEDPSMLIEKAEQLSQFLNQPQIYNKMSLMLETKICFVRCPEELKDFKSVISFCQNINKMIETSNKVVFLEEESQSTDFQIKHQIDHIINKGLVNKTFTMFYQPIYNTESKRFESAEALIRLYDDEFGFISPGIFIPVAEKSGAIHQIGDFVIEDVFRFISENNFKQLGLKYIEINLSVAQCMEANLVVKIKALMDKYKITPDKVNFEITETSAINDYELMDKNISMLSEMGFKFSLDDYGTGYSNIKRVTTLPISLIKMDKSFVDGLDKPGMKTVISETVSMFKKLNKELLIEGVEEEKQKEYFEVSGCDYIQGYYFSKPLAEGNFLTFIKDANRSKNE